MTRGVLDRSKLGELLRAASREAAVYAPAVRDEDQMVELELVATPSGATPALERVTLEHANTRTSAKRLFFPQTEVMFRFENGALAASADAPPPPLPLPIVAFAVRPCDALSLTYLDKVFSPGLTPYGDPYFAEKRARATVVGYACSSPCSTCFCTAVGGSPAGTAGVDALMTALGGKLLIEEVTDKGRAFIETHRALLPEPAPAAAAQAEAAHRAAVAAVPALATPSGRVERDTLKSAMDRGFEDPRWSRLTESCIGCGACTYLCPTCHCFDISDEERMYAGRRIRTWDSCQYPQFTKHASGHNPRPARKHRLRQRFMHKFSYTVEKSGDIYCVGCGRCVTGCPVNLDIREVVRAWSAPGA